MEERIQNIKTKLLAIRTEFMKKINLLSSPDENKALEVEYLSILENSLDTQVKFLGKTNLPVTSEYILAFQLNNNVESLMCMSLDYFIPFYAKLYETTQKRYLALNKQLNQQINVLKKHIREGKEIKQTFLDEVFYLQSSLVKCLELANFYIMRNASNGETV